MVLKDLMKEKGSTMVITALMLVVLIGGAALGIDGGYLYYRHTQVQDVADATALAAAIQLGSGNNQENKAFNAAKDYVKRNGFEVVSSNGYKAVLKHISSGNPAQMVVNFPGNQKVEVDIELDSELFFAKVFGKNSTDVNVLAIAQVGTAAKQTGGLIPVSIVDDPTNPNDGNYEKWRQYEMTLGPGGGVNGNFGWLDFGSYEGVNGNTLNHYLEYGYPGTLEYDQTITTQTGVAVGAAGSAINARLANCSAAFTTEVRTDGYTYYFESEIKTHLEADPNCPRLVYVPVVNSIGESGSTSVKIVGFAAFFLEKYSHDGSDIKLVGGFIDRLSPEEIIPSTIDYTVQSVMLIE